jgi:hypothetical protein
MVEINYVCSLGFTCHTAQFLKRNNIKHCSYPFDWIFSNSDIIIHCIQDKFKHFLDKSYYKAINSNKCQHTYYYKKNTDFIMFNHFNPLNDVNHYKYYVTRVNKFQDLLNKKQHKLFTMLFIDNTINFDQNNINKIIDFNNKFSKYTSNYTLLVIFHIMNKKENYHNFTYHDNIHFLELHTLSPSCRELNFTDNNDNIYLDNIIKSKYNFNIIINPHT